MLVDVVRGGGGVGSKKFVQSMGKPLERPVKGSKVKGTKREGSVKVLTPVTVATIESRGGESLGVTILWWGGGGGVV